jgi:hypothetical protein
MLSVKAAILQVHLYLYLHVTDGSRRASDRAVAAPAALAQWQLSLPLSGGATSSVVTRADSTNSQS